MPSLSLTVVGLFELTFRVLSLKTLLFELAVLPELMALPLFEATVLPMLLFELTVLPLFEKLPLFEPIVVLVTTVLPLNRLSTLVLVVLFVVVVVTVLELLWLKGPNARPQTDFALLAEALLACCSPAGTVQLGPTRLLFWLG